MESNRALEVDEVADLGSSSLRHSRVAAGFMSKRSTRRGKGQGDSLAQVRDTDTGGEVEQLLTLRGVKVQSLSLDDHMVPQSTKTVGDMLSTKVGPLGGRSDGCGHIFDGRRCECGLR